MKYVAMGIVSLLIVPLLAVYRLVDIGGIFQGIGGRRPRGPHLDQMAHVLYPYIP